MKKRPSAFILFSYSLVTVLLLLAGCGDNENNSIENVASVEYSVNSSGCLTSQNAEAVIDYTNGNNMSKTFIWNCASYNGNPQKLRVEEFFVSYDGGSCFGHYQTKNNDAICTERAVAPDKPLFEAKILSFDVTPLAGGDLSGYEVVTKITNTGNVSIFNLEANYTDQLSFMNQGTIWSTTATGITLDDHHGIQSNTPPSKTLDVTVKLKMWDGSVLDTQTKTVVIQ